MYATVRVTSCKPVKALGVPTAYGATLRCQFDSCEGAVTTVADRGLPKPAATGGEGRLAYGGALRRASDRARDGDGVRLTTFRIPSRCCVCHPGQWGWDGSGARVSCVIGAYMKEHDVGARWEGLRQLAGCGVGVCGLPTGPSRFWRTVPTLLL